MFARRPLVAALSVLFAATVTFAQTTPTQGSSAHEASSPPGDSPLYTVRTATLPNGMRVVYSPQPSTARVAVWVSWSVGASADPDGYHGLAHFLEHMLFQGTRHVRPGEFARRLQRAGAFDLNGMTGRDSTDYFEVVPAEQLPLALWLESDRIAFGPDAFTQSAVDAERRAVLNEFAVREGGVRGGSSYRFLSHALFPVGHPYHDVGDLGDDLAVITPDHLAWFFQTYYTPSNATLIIAGDFDVPAVEPLVASLFGTIGGGAAPTRPDVPRPVPPGGERRVRVLANVTTTSVVIAWNTPPFFEPGDAALDVLGELLAGDDSSVLYQRLVRSGLARGVSATQASMAHGSRFAIGISMNQGSPIAAVLPVVENALAEVRHGQIDPEALDEARMRWVQRTLAGADDPLTRAAAMSRYAAYWGDPDGFARDAERYRGLTLADLRRAARRWLGPNARVVESVEYRRGAPLGGRVVEASVGGR